MSLLKTFIESVGLDVTFFYQFGMVFVLYFLCKKLFLDNYAKGVEKRRETTKGRFSQSKDMEEKVEELKSLYEKKAQHLNKEFQGVFGEIKSSAEKTFKETKEQVEQEKRLSLEKEKEKMLQSKKEEDKKIEAEVPALVSSLVQKIRGSL